MHSLSPAYFFTLQKFAHTGLFNRCKYVWEALAAMDSYFSKQRFLIEIEIPDNVYLFNPESISIGEGSSIEPGAFIKGPCIIGKNCQIRHGAYIRGNFICGDSCVIGHDTEVKNSIFLDGTHAAHFAYVGDSILGNNVNLGAGTICANLKLKRDPIRITCENQIFDTGLKKLGAILGDNVQTGCNTVLNPGTCIGMNSLCYPCMNFGGFIPANRIVKKTDEIRILPNQ